LPLVLIVLPVLLSVRFGQVESRSAASPAQATPT
jgi:hypothetical protein